MVAICQKWLKRATLSMRKFEKRHWRILDNRATTSVTCEGVQRSLKDNEITITNLFL